MRITTLISAAAIALAATFGAASAADQFTTLDGVAANPMSSGELDAVKGLHIHFQIFPNGEALDPPSNASATPLLCGGPSCIWPLFRVGDVNLDADGNAPGINGISTADGNGTIHWCDGPC